MPESISKYMFFFVLRLQALLKKLWGSDSIFLKMLAPVLGISLVHLCLFLDLLIFIACVPAIVYLTITGKMVWTASDDDDDDDFPLHRRSGHRYSNRGRWDRY